MPRKPDPNSEASIAKRLSGELGISVTRKMLHVWKAKGYPLDDIDALKKALMNQERRPAGLTTSKPNSSPAKKSLSAEDVELELARLQRELLECDDYETARTINTKITGVRNVLKELREQRHYIRITEATNAASMAAVASKAAWEGLEDDLPPRLEGMTASQIKKELRDYGRVKAREIAETFGVPE